jgi:hypothetical protein
VASTDHGDIIRRAKGRLKHGGATSRMKLP